jgi:hypothetical protein
MGQEEAEGLMRLTAPPRLRVNREVRPREFIPPGHMEMIISNVYYWHAIVIFHGDGDPYIQLNVSTSTYGILFYATEFKVITLAEDILTVFVHNLSPHDYLNAPTIEILSLSPI